MTILMATYNNVVVTYVLPHLHENDDKINLSRVSKTFAPIYNGLTQGRYGPVAPMTCEDVRKFVEGRSDSEEIVANFTLLTGNMGCTDLVSTKALLKYTSHDATRFRGRHRNAFVGACEKGHLVALKWALEPVFVDNPKRQWGDFGQLLLHTACRSGHLELAKWLLVSMFPPSPKTGYARLEKLLFHQTEYKDIPTLAWSLSLFDNDKPSQRGLADAFLTACQAGYLHITIWLYRKYSDVITEKLLKRATTPWEGFGPFIKDLCLYSNGFDTVLWLHTVFDLPEDIMTTALDELEQQNSFSYACEDGNLPAAKWLLGKFGPSAMNPLRALIMACENGQLHVAKWLHETFHFTTLGDPQDMTGQHALLNACTTEHIHVVAWLCTTFREVIEHDLLAEAEGEEEGIHRDDIEFTYANVERYVTEFLDSLPFT